MNGVRTPALVAGGILALLILAVMIGDAIEAAGVVKDPSALQTPAKIVFFALFVAFGFSLIPLMVRLVLGFQVLIGNKNVAPVRIAVARSNWIVGIIWALMAAGLATALPAAIGQGFFAGGSPESATPSDAIANTPVQGTLVAAPGMQTGRMLADSTLKVRTGSNSPLFSGARYGGAAIFDYRVAGTTTVFRRCRYYYVTVDERHPKRIAMVNVGISAEKLTRAQLTDAERDVAARLRSDGWKLQRANAWSKGGIVLDVRSRRLDDPVSGEDPARAGEWIQYVELRSYGR